MPRLQTIALALCASVLAGTAAANDVAARTAPQPYVNYSAVTGYFLQDEPNADPTTFDYVQTWPTLLLDGSLLLTKMADGGQFRPY